MDLISCLIAVYLFNVSCSDAMFLAASKYLYAEEEASLFGLLAIYVYYLGFKKLLFPSTQLFI
jgi:hypothetical protein